MNSARGQSLGGGTAETTPVITSQPTHSIDLSPVDEILDRHGRGPEATIAILQAIQSRFHYLPQEALEYVCSKTGISAAQLTGVASFYTQFRHRPVGEHMIHVCRGTACHVKGADLIMDALVRHLRIPPGQDTDPEGRFTVQPVACLGCCTLAPVVQIDQATYGRLTPHSVPRILTDFLDRSSNGAVPRNWHFISPQAAEAEIRVGLGSCCQAQGSRRVYEQLQELTVRNRTPAVVKRVGCVGMCHQTPLVEIVPRRGTPRLYAKVRPEDVAGIFDSHFRPRNPIRRLRYHLARWLDALVGASEEAVDRHRIDVRDPPVCAFLGRQYRIAIEHGGETDPLDLDEYLRRDGFHASRRVWRDLSPQSVIEEIERSGLRGRGGAGFPTARKWRIAAAAASDIKYVICNGDEGDPGAFMDRMILESFPYRVIEGMLIAARAVGATHAVFYIRAEYPLAVERVREALRRCQERGILDGKSGGEYPVTFSVSEGAGAFVCGEETALLASVEGRRGMPRLRPPYPVESGLNGRPTVVNNVETLALVPWILRHGTERFAALGTPGSKGTKVFALAGKVQRGGLIEVPMGVTLHEIIEEIGGGALPGRTLKAVQVGGPSGGCVPASLFDTPVDYEALTATGAIMGSGGLVVLDDSDCMVDIARYFLRFTQDQSCGKCTLCRVGTRRMLDILDRICEGRGRPDDLTTLENLSRAVSAGSICGLGKTAPNPVLTTLRYFREEYEAHLQGRCPAGKCVALIHYRITDDCIGCTLCAQQCPVHAIPLTPYRKHEVHDELCTRCDTCLAACPAGAVIVESGGVEIRRAKVARGLGAGEAAAASPLR